MHFLIYIILSLLKFIFTAIILAWVTHDALISKCLNQRFRSPSHSIPKALTLLRSPLLKSSLSLKLKETSLLALFLSLAPSLFLNWFHFLCLRCSWSSRFPPSFLSNCEQSHVFSGFCKHLFPVHKFQSSTDIRKFKDHSLRNFYVLDCGDTMKTSYLIFKVLKTLSRKKTQMIPL